MQLLILIFFFVLLIGGYFYELWLNQQYGDGFEKYKGRYSQRKSKNTPSELLYCVIYQFQFLVGMYYIPGRNIRSTNIQDRSPYNKVDTIVT